VYSIPPNNPSGKEILSGLLADKGGAAQISIGMPCSGGDLVSLLLTFNHAIDEVVQRNPKALAQLAQLDGYKRPLVNVIEIELNDASVLIR
jgi:hypothetical protein